MKLMNPALLILAMTFMLLSCGDNEAPAGDESNGIEEYIEEGNERMEGGINDSIGGIEDKPINNQ